ncbi:hypothetical protein PENSPDRAFT_681965 [Peniophora sp. CONT]|nr:hypothetical protein PENSPDRAFT_681965 [Peniophora sp. CONT]
MSSSAPSGKKNKATAIKGRRSSGQGSNPNGASTTENNTQSTQLSAGTSTISAIPQARKRTRRPTAYEQLTFGETVGSADGLADAFLDAFTASTSATTNKDKTFNNSIVTDVVVEQVTASDAPMASTAEDDVVMADDESEDENSSLFGDPLDIFGEPMDVDPVPNIPLKAERGVAGKSARATKGVAPLSQPPSASTQPLSQRDLPPKPVTTAPPVKAEAQRKAPKAEKKSTTTTKSAVKTSAKKAAPQEDKMHTACELVATAPAVIHAVPAGMELMPLGKKRQSRVPSTSKVQATPSDPSTSTASGPALQSGAAATQQQATTGPKKHKAAYGVKTATTDPRRRASTTTSVVPAPAVSASQPPPSVPTPAVPSRKATRPTQPSVPAPIAIQPSAAAPAAAQAGPAVGSSSTLVSTAAIVSAPSAQPVQPIRPLTNAPVVTNLQPIDTGVERPRTATKKLSPAKAAALSAKPTAPNSNVAGPSTAKKTVPAVVAIPASSAQAKENTGGSAASAETSLDRVLMAQGKGKRPFAVASTSSTPAASTSAAAPVNPRPAPAPLALPSVPPSPKATEPPLVAEAQTLVRALRVSMPAALTDIIGPTRRPPPALVEVATPASESVVAPEPVTPSVPQKRFNADPPSEAPSKRQRVSPKIVSPPLPSSSMPVAAAQQLVPHEKHYRGNDQLVDIQCGRMILNGWCDDLVKASDVFRERIPLSTSVPPNNPFVDVSDRCQDVRGVELILSELLIERAGLRPTVCSQEELRRLLRASDKLQFKAIFNRCADVLRKTWPVLPWRIAQVNARIPLLDALDTIRCVRECDPQFGHLRDVYIRAAYEMFSACSTSFHWREAMEALGLMVGDAPNMDRVDDINAVRDYCQEKWAKYRDAPNKEYPSICPHAEGAGPSTQEQRDDKARRWLEAMIGIHKGFKNSATDWTFDPLRAIWAIRSNHQVRPKGWQQCPEGKCRAIVYGAWDRRLEREWEQFQVLIRKHIWLEVVEGSQSDG